MPTKEQIEAAGWTNVRPMADGRLAGDSEVGSAEHPPAYGIMVDGQGEAVEGVVRNPRRKRRGLRSNP